MSKLFQWMSLLKTGPVVKLHHHPPSIIPSLYAAFYVMIVYLMHMEVKARRVAEWHTRKDVFDLKMLKNRDRSQWC